MGAHRRLGAAAGGYIDRLGPRSPGRDWLGMSPIPRCAPSWRRVEATAAALTDAIRSRHRTRTRQDLRRIQRHHVLLHELVQRAELVVSRPNGDWADANREGAAAMIALLTATTAVGI